MVSPLKTLIVASFNQGKIKEIASFFSTQEWIVQGLKEVKPLLSLPEETGSTFKDNALIKARAVWNQTKGYVLADDSGLECEDLSGEPGVCSARYAGPQATDDQNNRKLIRELIKRHDPSRRARYVCALVLIDSTGKETVVEETCDGMITFVPSGTGGFGYDPYFYLPEKKCTMAELPLEKKNKISHRGKALAELIKIIRS